ncbi:fibronectin type III domain-containing protein [Neptunitalea lumnitzerae]|nr:fibronectin type III domain-containing protein [Neptunitalea sp. Y10]
MRKTTLLILFMLLGSLGFAQVLNEPGNWPNTNWTVTGSYDANYLYEDPTTSDRFSFDDDDAGLSSINSVAAESPVIDLTPAVTGGETWMFFTTPYVYRQYTSASITVEYWDADAAAWISWIAPFNTSTTSAPTSSYCSGTYENLSSTELDISGFTATQLSGFKYRILFDDGGAYAYGFCFQSPTVYSSAPPDCPTPSSLATGTIMADTAEISWVENGGETTWNVQYGPTGFALGTGTTDVATTNPYTISNLSASTEYDVYVQVACAAGGSSLWEGPMTFLTACTYQVAPYTQDFENSGAIPNCWEQGTSNSEDWIFATSAGHVGDAGTISGVTNSGGYFAYVDDSSPNNIGSELYTPYVDVSALTTPALSFFMISNNEGYSNVDFAVDIFDGTTWHDDVYTSNTNKPLWTKIYIDLSTYTISGPVQARFVIDDNNTTFYDDLAIDDISFDELPSCLDITEAATDATTSDSATITVLQTGSAAGWNIEYGPAGFTQGTGATMAATSATFTITGLTPATDYEYYVQTDCGGGDLATWMGPYTFTTECTSFVAPYTQGFENAGAIPNCWEQGASNAEDWIFATSATYVGTGGTVSGSTATGGYFAYVDDSSTNNNGTTLVTPFVDISTLTTPALSFYLISDSQSGVNVEFSVDFYDGATWHNDVYFSNTDKLSWTQIFIDLSTYTISGDVQARFVVDENNTTYYDDLAIDDITFDELPACIDPTDLALDTITDTTATITLNQVGTAVDYNIEYGPLGFTPGAGSATTVSTIPFTISGLTGNTDYEVYVQTNCGGGDTSTWIGPFAFTTLCSPIVAPYYEDFENAGSIPSCWTQGATNSEDWIFATSATYLGPGTSQSGGYFAYVDDSSTDNVGTTLVTPLFDVSALTTPSLYFYLNSDSGDIYSNVDFSIDVFDGTTWTDDVFFLNTDTSEWEFTVVDLSPYASSGTIQIRFVVDENNGTDFYNDLAIDDIHIDELPTCLPVIDLDATNMTTSDAELSWTSTGSETAWNIEYGPEGFTLGTGTTVPAGSNPFTLTGLDPATDYDYYVTSDCGGGDASITTGPFTFTTECAIYGTPYHETFENGGDIPNCWEQGASNSEDWIFATTAGYVGDGGTITGSTSSGGHFAYVDDSSPNNTGTSLISPQVDISGLGSPALLFYLISDNQGSTSVDFSVDFYDGAAWNNAIFTSNSNTNGWELVSIDLSSYTITGPVRARFVVDENNTTFYDDLAIDDVMFDEMPTCDIPSDILVTNPTTIGGDISWTENGTAEAWIIEYGPVGFTPGTGTSVTVYTNPVTLEGLNDSTTYDIYIQAECYTSQSLQIGPATLTTECAVQVAPYAQGFENAGDIPNCWEQGAANIEDWVFATSGGHVGDTGTLSGATDTDNYFAYVDDSSPNNTGTELYTPFIDVSALTTPSMYFYMISNNEGYSNVDFSVDIYDGSAWNNDVFTSNTNKTSWTQIYIDLSVFTITGPIQARFVVDDNNTTFYDDIAIDDVTFDELPSCLAANGAVVNSVTADTAEISIYQAGSPTSWNIEYGTPGFTPDTGAGTIVNSTTNPLTLTGLTPATDYEFYVQSDCSGTTTAWVGPFSFTTECATFMAPYTEGFENSGNIPNCWSQGASNAEDWIFSTSASYAGTGGTLSGSTATGGYFAYVDDSSTNNNGTTLVTPFVDLSALTIPSLSFYIISDSQTGDNVEFSVDFYDGATWHNDVYFSDTDKLSWTQIYIDLSTYTISGPVQARFVVDENNTTYYDDLAIDDITFDELPSMCFEPTGVAITSTTDTTAELSIFQPGTVTGWNIEYGTPGFTQGTGSTVSATTNPYTLTGLSAATTYEFYIQTDCSGSTTAWVGPFSFTTECATFVAPYTQDFENGGSIPNCWEQGSSNGEDWIFATSGGHVGNAGTLSGSTTSGSYFAYVDDSSASSIGTTLYTPYVDITTLTNPVLTFFMISNNEGYTNVDFSVDFYDGATWHDDVYFSNSNVTSWTQMSIDLSTYTISGPVQARFVVDENNGSDFYDDVAIDDITFEDANTTATDNFANVNFNYYPNPVNNNMLTLTANKEMTTVNVINLLGQQVMMLEPNASNYTVNMSELASGTYFVEVWIGESSKTVKIIKE